MHYQLSLSLLFQGFCKIDVRHILFKKICFFDFLKLSPNCLLYNNLLFERKKTKKTIFFFSKYAYPQFCRTHLLFPQYGIRNVYFDSENIKLPDVLDICKA